MLREKIFFVFVLFTLSYICPICFGSEFIRRHSLVLGVDFALSNGDFNGKSIDSDEESAPETVILQQFPRFFVYTLDAAVMFDAHSVALNAGYGLPNKARYLRLGLEYQYRFFWQEPLQFGIGAGYAFSSMRFSEATFEKNTPNERSYANFTGNGFYLIASSDYYFNKNLALEADMRCFFLRFNTLATASNNISKLNNALWQIMYAPGLKLKFVF